MDEREPEGKRWPLTAPWKWSALFWNCVHKFRIWSRCGYYADNCSIEKVQIILVPFRFYNADIIRIIEFVNGVYIVSARNITFWPLYFEWQDQHCQWPLAYLLSYLADYIYSWMGHQLAILSYIHVLFETMVFPLLNCFSAWSYYYDNWNLLKRIKFC